MYLERDAFRVEYDPGDVALDQIFERIRELGYSPSRTDDARSLEPTLTRAKTSALPKPIAGAKADNRLILVDFHAKWCAPCRALERTVLSQPKVKRALETYRFVKVDTDAYPAAAKYFGVVGLPTLIVVDRIGNERFRHVGPITVDDLVRTLAEMRSENPSPDKRVPASSR